MKKIIVGLSIIFIVFISLFALDVFEQEKWFLALVMHLIPSFLLIIITIISRKKEFLGGILWLILGMFFLIMNPQVWIIYGPIIIIGGLNLWAGKNGKRNNN